MAQGNLKTGSDFDSVVKRVQSNDRNNNTSWTEKYQAHNPSVFLYYIVCVDDKFSENLCFT